jgi:hypothetical protein
MIMPFWSLVFDALGAEGGTDGRSWVGRTGGKLETDVALNLFGHGSVW